MIFRYLTLFGAVCALSTTTGVEKEDPVYMLPKNVKPMRYNLTMVPDFKTDTYSGSVIIELVALKTSNYITLHTLDLNMPSKNEILLQELETGTALGIESAQVTDTTYQYFTINLSTELTENTVYILSLPNFSGKFNKGQNGFASGTYTEADGSVHYYAYTQFQPTDARRAFPCFDEPALRAKFNVRLVRPNENFISASNSPLISQSNVAPFEDVFEETVEMPTYLLAFTVTEMRFSETVDIYRIITRPEVLAACQHEYALGLTVKVFDVMETFTHSPFVLPKLDQIGIPTYSGGMENWGLIVYGEPSLLLINENNKPGIVSIVAHEIAHQWFGNLIGITWWKYIWLNEGFATYFQRLVPSQVESTIDGRPAFLYSMQGVLTVDVRIDTRPLSQNAELPWEIMFLFDSIAYQKGCHVIRMLEKVLTTPVFQKGVQYYLDDMQFKQATPTDLYRNLQRAVDESVNMLPELVTVADFMSAWENVKGFPVVNVQRNYGTNTVSLEQKRYLTDPVSEDGNWMVPLNFATNSNRSFENTDPEQFLKQSHQTITIPYLNDNDWLIVNKQETSFYRVNYDEDNWKLITDALLFNHLDIHVLNRGQLIDDCLNLAKTGRLDYEIASNLVKYIANEKDPIPWTIYAQNTRKLAPMFYYSSHYETFRKYNFKLIERVYNKIGFEEKDHESTLQKDLRKSVLNLLCRFGHSDCTNKALNKFRYWQRFRKNISTLEPSTLCGAVRAGKQEVFAYLYNNLKHAEEKMNVIKGLSCSRNINNLNRLLHSHDLVDLDVIIEAIIESGPEGLQAGITFISLNFATVEEKLDNKIISVLRKVSDLISTDSQLKQMKVAVSGSKHTKLFEQLFVESEKNVEWRKRNSRMVIKKLMAGL